MEAELSNLLGELPPFIKRKLKRLHRLDVEVTLMQSDAQKRFDYLVRRMKKGENVPQEEIEAVRVLHRASLMKADQKISITDEVEEKLAAAVSSLCAQRKELTARVKRSRKPKSSSRTSLKTMPPELPSLEEDAPVEHYCYCHQPSHSKMIACDNKNCQFQWFHFECLGLKDEPTEESWFCPDCRMSQE
uniref:PHD-type domain-containing protein n=1 Tax=Steinernema glaseri TaxID=37863 RepID=A0A1I7YPL9_9BILA